MASEKDDKPKKEEGKTKEKKPKKEKNEKKTKKDKKGGEEEPEFCLFQVPTYKPKAYKDDSDLKKLKAGKPMDVKFFKDGIKLYQPGKKKPKRAISYSQLAEMTRDEHAPELVRLTENAKGKKFCHQLVITDDENRQKVQRYLGATETLDRPRSVSVSLPRPASKGSISSASSDRSSRRPPTVQNMGAAYTPNHTARNTGFASSDFSKSAPSAVSSNHKSNVHYEPSNRPKPTHFRAGIRNADVEARSEHGYDRRSRSIGFGQDYYPEGNDFDSNSDQLTRSDRRSEYKDYAQSGGFYGSGRPGSSYYGQSRITYDDGYDDEDDEDDEYGSETSGYGDYESGYSDQTVVARPVKPRSLTFYSPFLKVPRNTAPYY